MSSFAERKVRMVTLVITVCVLCLGNFLSWVPRHHTSSYSSTSSLVYWEQVANSIISFTSASPSASPSGSPSGSLSGQPKATSSSQLNTVAEPMPISLCLLIKDDNRILSEFIGYHYHTIHLRRVIVAVDPDSQTSPADVLEPWAEHFGLNYTLWHDRDYMPTSFVNGSGVRDLPWVLTGKEYKKDPATNLITSKYFTGNDESTGKPYTQDQIMDGLYKINNHRIRQRRFVSQCYRRLKTEGYTWTLHIDTDEYVVPNPHLRKHRDVVEKTPPDVRNAPEADFLGSDITSDPTGIEVPKRPTADSVQTFFRTMMDRYAYLHPKVYRNCLKIPRVLFGSRERVAWTNGTQQPAGATSTLSLKNNTADTHLRQFETLRWIYSAKLEERYNGYPKTILNVASIPDDNYIFKEPRLIESVHNPLSSAWGKECACHGGTFPFLPPEGDVDKAVNLWKEKGFVPRRSGILDRPLIANHYIGSLKDFMSRNDHRRTPNDHQQKAKHSNSREDDRWMAGWVASFIQDHGLEKVKLVLGQYDLSGV
jgi:hypothetical protein